MNIKLNSGMELNPAELTPEDKEKLLDTLKDDGAWPKYSDSYYYIGDESSVIVRYWMSDYVDGYRKSIGNMFKTEEAAQKHLTYLKALQVLKGDTNGYEWKLGDNYASVCWNTTTDNLDLMEFSLDVWEGLKFKTDKDAAVSMEAHPKEWRIVLGVDDA